MISTKEMTVQMKTPEAEDAIESSIPSGKTWDLETYKICFPYGKVTQQWKKQVKNQSHL